MFTYSVAAMQLLHYTSSNIQLLVSARRLLLLSLSLWFDLCAVERRLVQRWA